MHYQTLKQGLPCQLTDTLTIRLIRESDLTDIVKMLANPKVCEYLFFAPAPVEVYEAFFMPIIENTRQAIEKGEWPDNPTFIIHNTNDEYMGMVGLTQAMMLAGNFDIGYQLPEHSWQQGIASRACQFVTALAFEQLGAHKLSADCYAGNQGSVRVLEKSGYVAEGCQKDYYRLENGFDDRLWFGMTKAQYNKRNTKNR